MEVEPEGQEINDLNDVMFTHHFSSGEKYHPLNTDLVSTEQMFLRYW